LTSIARTFGHRVIDLDKVKAAQQTPRRELFTHAHSGEYLEFRHDRRDKTLPSLGSVEQRVASTIDPRRWSISTDASTTIVIC